MKHSGSVLASLLVLGCVEHRLSPTAGQVATLEVNVVDPPPDKLGSPEAPVPVRSTTFDVIARDETGAVVPRDLAVQVFISFGGVKTGAAGACGADDTGTVPITTLTLTGGQLANQTVDLPLAFGSTSLWIDEPTAGATGASSTIYFRNAYIDEVQTPPDPMEQNATFCSPLNHKFLIVDHARPGGKLVVSSVFGNAFAVTDTARSTFNSIYLFAFGKPPGYIVEGRVLKSFSGNYSKFVGFTELNFPLFDADLDGPLEPLPAPPTLAQADIATPATMLGYSASVVQYSGTICDPLKSGDSWTKFNQFILDNDGTCASFTNIAIELPAKVLGAFDPLKAANKQATIVGMLRNNSGQNPYLDTNGNAISCTTQMPCTKGTCIDGTCYKNAFNFWTIQPRREGDITVAP